MADSVDSLVVYNGKRKYIVRLTNVSDGTGESAVIKVDISTLFKLDGTAPTKTSVKEIYWNIQGFSSVRLFWDHTTDDEIAMLSGSGYMDLTETPGLVDPASAGGTGDILLTTANAASGATYTIILVVELL